MGYEWKFIYRFCTFGKCISSMLIFTMTANMTIEQQLNKNLIRRKKPILEDATSPTTSICVLSWSGGAYTGPCTGLPSRSLLSQHRHQRAQFLRSTKRRYVLSLLSVLVLAFSVVGPSVWNGLPLALRLLPRFSLTHSTLALKLLLLAVLESGALLSSNLEEAVYEFM